MAFLKISYWADEEKKEKPLTTLIALDAITVVNAYNYNGFLEISARDVESVSIKVDKEIAERLAENIAILSGIYKERCPKIIDLDELIESTKKAIERSKVIDAEKADAQLL